MTFSSKFVAALAVTSALAATSAHAALTPALKCQTGKLKTVASFASCLLKTEAKAVGNMLTPDFTKCREKIDIKFPKYEANAGPGVCPSEGDLVDIRDRTEAFETEIAILLSGGIVTTTTTSTTSTTTTLPPGSCGNGIVEFGEECDVGNLDGETCATQGNFNGTLLCGAGCQFDTSQCNPTRFEDTGATIIDYQTGLEWEKKTNSDGVANLANANDVDNTYTWTGAAMGTTMSGTLFSDFLTKLNGTVDHATTTTLTCFDNHCDWRLPNVDELKSIQLNPGCGAAPCIVNAALLPNRSGRYWSRSTRVIAPTGAYFVDFTNPPLVASDAKTVAYFARAVRTLSN
jgi:hypothetical protein